MDKKYDVIAIGMGPSSVFMAYELVQLKKYKKMLNSSPNIITNKVSDMYIKVSKLIVGLKSNKICNKNDLIMKLKKDKNFLKDAIIMWYDNPNIKKIIREKRFSQVL